MRKGDRGGRPPEELAQPEIFPNQIKLSKILLESGFNKIEVFDIIDGLSSIHIADK